MFTYYDAPGAKNIEISEKFKPEVSTSFEDFI